MSNKSVRSLRGEIVDFDMLKIKSEIGSIPETADVKFRENIIQSRRRRKNSSKRKVKDMLAQQQINQKAVRLGLEKQRKQLAVTPDAVDAVTVEPPSVEVELTSENTNLLDDEVKQETTNRKIRKNQNNATNID